MNNVWRLFRFDLGRLKANVMSIIITLGLVLVPSLFAWYNIIACWNVFDNTGNLTVAVANTDEGYQSDLIPLRINIGDQVVSALRANDQIDWHITDEEDAIDGAKSGRYYAAVVIPKSFSRDMLTFYTGDAGHADIVYYANEKKSAIAPKITDQGADTVSYQVNAVFAQTLSEVSLSLAESLSSFADEDDWDGRIAVVADHVREMADAFDDASGVLSLYGSLARSCEDLSRHSADLATQASTALDETLYRENLTVALPMESITLSPADTGVQVDVRAAVNDAYRMGRSDGSLPGNMDLRPYLSVNSEYIRTALEGYASEFDTEFSDSHYTLTGDAPDLGTENHAPSAPCQTLELTVGVPKAHLDVDSACDQILRAYSQAVAACRAGEYRVTVDIPAESAPAELDLDAIYDEICTAPVDDSLDMTEYRFVPGSYGYSFDLDAAKAALAQAKPGETVSVPMTFVEPEILGDAVYFRDVLGSCETKHSDNENRNTNLRLLCEALNGVVVQPGETFSYNDTLGERTAEKGYKPAPAYSGNRLGA